MSKEISDEYRTTRVVTVGVVLTLLAGAAVAGHCQLKHAEVVSTCLEQGNDPLECDRMRVGG